MFETLESRQLLAASPAVTAKVSSGTLTVTGTDHSEAITIKESGPNMAVLVDNVKIASFNSVTKIVVNAGKGDDSVQLKFSTLSLPATISGGAGDDTIRTSGGADSINGNAGN